MLNIAIDWFKSIEYLIAYLADSYCLIVNNVSSIVLLVRVFKELLKKCNAASNTSPLRVNER